jgi:hypothetical protein
MRDSYSASWVIVRPLFLSLALGPAVLTSAEAQAEPEIPLPLEFVAAGVVSTDGGEAFPTLTPDGTSLYFATDERGWTGLHIVVSLAAGTVRNSHTAFRTPVFALR